MDARQTRHQLGCNASNSASLIRLWVQSAVGAEGRSPPEYWVKILLCKISSALVVVSTAKRFLTPNFWIASNPTGMGSWWYPAVFTWKSKLYGSPRSFVLGHSKSPIIDNLQRKQMKSEWVVCLRLLWNFCAKSIGFNFLGGNRELNRFSLAKRTELQETRYFEQSWSAQCIFSVGPNLY